MSRWYLSSKTRLYASWFDHNSAACTFSGLSLFGSAKHNERNIRKRKRCRKNTQLQKSTPLNMTNITSSVASRDTANELQCIFCSLRDHTGTITSEETLYRQQDGSDVVERRPLFLENVEANVTAAVDVRMIARRLEFHDGRLVRIAARKFQHQLV